MPKATRRPIETLMLLCVLLVQPSMAQAESRSKNACGAECLYVAFATLTPDRTPANFTEFSRRIRKATGEGYSMATLQDIAKEFGLNTQLARLTTDALDWHCRHGLVILKVSGSGTHHFVLCEKVDGGHVQVYDAKRRFVIPTTALESKWEGESLILSTESITPPRQASRMRWPIAIAAVLLLLATSFYFVRRKQLLAAFCLLAMVCVCGCQRQASMTGQQASTSSQQEPAVGSVAVEPSMIDLRGVIQTTAKEFPILDVAVGAVNQSVIRLSGAGVGAAQAESVTVKVIPGIEHHAVIANGECRLEAKVDESVEPGLYHGAVEISSTANPNTHILVPWTLRVTAPLAIAPNKLYFFTSAETNLVGAQIVVDFSEPYRLADLRIEPVPANLSSFSVDIEATGNQGCVVDVSVSPEDRARLTGLSFRLGSEYSRVLKVHE